MYINYDRELKKKLKDVFRNVPSPMAGKTFEERLDFVRPAGASCEISAPFSAPSSQVTFWRRFFPDARFPLAGEYQSKQYHVARIRPRSVMGNSRGRSSLALGHARSPNLSRVYARKRENGKKKIGRTARSSHR